MSLFKDIAKKSRKDPETVYLAPFGGVGEFGMNMMGYVYRGNLFLVDAGIMFPRKERLGVDALFPDISEAIGAFGKVKAYLITHGHEDHLGAMPFLMAHYPAPVLGPPWAMALLKSKLNKLRIGNPDHIEVVSQGDTRTVSEGVECTWIGVNHSIPDACSLHLSFGPRRILHSGDFKLDESPLYEPRYNEEMFRKFRGVDLLVSDSTGADKPGRCPGEGAVVTPLRDHIEAGKNRVFVTTFSSNLWRLISVANIGFELGRPVYFIGRGLEKTYDIAHGLGLTKHFRGNPILDRDASGYAKDGLFLVTGCQGEYHAALTRILRGDFSGLKITNEDKIIFSSRLIPGNELSVFQLLATCKWESIEVVTSKDDAGIHVSGHGFSEDILQLLDLVAPKHHIPVHGSCAHLMDNFNRSSQAGLTTSRMLDGMIFRINGAGVEAEGFWEPSHRFVSSMTAHSVSYETLRQRLRIGESGLVLLSGAVSMTKQAWQDGPTVDIIGLLDESHANDVSKQLEKFIKGLDWTGTDDINEFYRSKLRREAISFLGKKPMVYARISEVKQ